MYELPELEVDESIPRDVRAVRNGYTFWRLNGERPREIFSGQRVLAAVYSREMFGAIAHLMNKTADDDDSGPQQHLALTRLQEIATDSGPKFTLEEWQHLRYCIECLEHYLRFVRTSR